MKFAPAIMGLFIPFNYLVIKYNLGSATYDPHRGPNLAHTRDPNICALYTLRNTQWAEMAWKGGCK